MAARWAFGGRTLSLGQGVSASDHAIGRIAGAAGLIAAALFSPAAALAGAWTVPQGTGLIIASLFGWTGVGAPWGGNHGVKQNKVEGEAYVEYGLTDQLTIFGQTGLERYALSPPTRNTYQGLDYSDIGVRAKLWSTGGWVFSGEAAFFVPGAKNPSAPAQVGNTGKAGEGRLLAGYGFSVAGMPGFLDVEGGYRIRTAGPPNEWHADFTVGLKPTPGLMLMLQDFTTVSTASTNREFPAWRSSILQASVVVDLDSRWSLQIAAFASVLAVKTNTERGAALAIWRKF